MKFGCCLGFAKQNNKIEVNNIAELSAAGYDYVELPASAVAQLSESECKYLVENIKSYALDTGVANLAFPGDIDIIGDKVDYVKVDDYLSVMMGNLSLVGVKKLVLGSGKIRSIPSYLGYEQGASQLKNVIRRMSKFAEPYNITVVLEPLNRLESNIINSVTEACLLAREINLESVQILCDYYHMVMEQEAVEVIPQIKLYGLSLQHVHIANPVGRIYPTDGEDYSVLFSALKEAGYDQTISVEGKTDDFALDSAMAIKTLKKYVE